MDMQIDELNKQMRLLVCYPVIGDDYQNIAEQYKEAVDDGRRRFHSNINDADSDDVIGEMERQMEANAARIDILKKQNDSLESTLLKFDEGRRLDEKQVSDESFDLFVFCLINQYLELLQGTSMCCFCGIQKDNLKYRSNVREG